MKTTKIFLVTLILSVQAYVSVAAIVSSGATVAITVDYSQDMGAFDTYLFGALGGVGSDTTAYLTLQAGGFKLIEVGVAMKVPLDASDLTQYDFTTLDQQVSGILNAGAEPLIWFSPSAKPQDLSNYALFAQNVAKHLTQGWGNGHFWSINAFRFGNEPDNTDYWTGTQQDFFDTYGAWAKALKAVNSAFVLDAPGLMDIRDKNGLTSWVTGFLSYCQTNSVPVDYFSAHAYSPLVYYQFYDNFKALASELQKYPSLSPLYGTPRLANNEWNIMVGDAWSGSYHPQFDTAWVAAHNIAAMAAMVENGLGLSIRYGGASNGGAKGCHDFPMIGSRDVASCDNAKPVYYAFQGFNKLQGTRHLAATGSDHVNFTATAGKKTDEVTIVLANFDIASYMRIYESTAGPAALQYSQYISSFGAPVVYDNYALNLKNLPWTDSQQVSIRRYAVDNTNKLALVETKTVAGTASLNFTAAISTPSVQVLTFTTAAGTVSKVDVSSPTVPDGLISTASLSSQISLFWTASTDDVGVAGYKIYRNEVHIASTTVNAYTDSGLSAGTTYTYQVAAYDAAGNASAKSASAAVFVVTPVYLTFVMHNEEPGGSGGCYGYLENKQTYLKDRETLRQLVETLKNKGAKFDWQSDWAFLKAAALYDTGDAVNNTNGKNIVRWMKEDMGVSVDPHGHETQYNYADVAYLIKQLGVTPSSVAGGFLYYPYDNSQGWEKFRNPIQASTNTDASYSWRGEILWGAGTYLHQGDDEDSSGIWKPKDKYAFGSHDEAGNLINVGNAGSSMTKVPDMIQRIDSGELQAGKIYTVSHFVAQCGLSSVTISSIAQSLDGLQGYVNQGKLIHATLPEAVQLWQTSYSSQSSRYDPTPPIAAITSPASGSILSGTTYLAASASNVVSVQFYLDGGAIGGALDIQKAGQVSLDWDSRQSADGVHIITAKVMNAAADTVLSNPVSVTVVNGSVNSGSVPPINIVFDVHIEDMGENHGTPNLQEYNRLRTEVIWLSTTADAYGAKLSLQSNGEYMEHALEQGHASDFTAYITGGHDVGTHGHPYTWEGSHDWRRQRFNADDLSVSSRVWADNSRFVNSVLTTAGYLSSLNNVMSAQVPEDKTQNETLMRAYGFQIEGGGRNEDFFKYFGHDVFNPWRPGKEGTLDEDITNKQFLIVPHTSQIGAAEYHGPASSRKYLDNTTGALKKRFLMLLLEWLYRERNGSADKVWVFGWNTHPQVNAFYRKDIDEILNWLNAGFIGKNSYRGNKIARYSSFSQVRNEFLAWESSHAGTSSFEYKEGGAYPYSFEPMAQRLWNKDGGQTSRYETEITTWAKNGVHCHKLLYKSTPSQAETPLYVMWSDSQSVKIDFSGQLNGSVLLTDLRTGTTNFQASSSLSVGPDPVFAESASEIILETIPSYTTEISPIQDNLLSLASEKASVRVEIPKQTFTEILTVSVSIPAAFPETVSSKDELIPTGIGVEIKLDKTSYFYKEVTIEITYDEQAANSFDESRLILARYDENIKTWVPLESTAYPEQNKVIGKTDHFSLFQVMQQDPGVNLSGARIYPNPFYPNKGHEKVIFDKLPAGAKVKVFTLQGELVWEGETNSSGMAFWYGKNKAGRKAASGVYIAYFEHQKEKKTLKLSVIK